MAISSVKILLIEDSLAEARLLHEILKGAKLKLFNLVHVKRLREALDSLLQDSFDVILLDLTLPDSQGLASLAPLMTYAPSLPIVVLTNTNDNELAIEAVRRGAQDYLVKREVNTEVLVRSICYAIERKQGEESLRKANEALQMRVQERTAELVKATEINQLKTEFVTMMSHDFRNPLNAVLLYTGLLEDRNYQLMNEEKKHYHLQLIRSALNNMAQLLDEVSVIGRADAGKLQCQLAPLCLEDFCFELVEEVQVCTKESYQINFASNGNFDNTLWDEKLLRHILGNLLGNALKYSPEGSTIEFQLIAQEETAIFQIKDRGIGISPEDRKRLFQPFNRGNNVGRIPGTGLGLAIVKKCVEAHGGEISLSSEVGVGTTFTVTLPLIKDLVESDMLNGDW